MLITRRRRLSTRFHSKMFKVQPARRRANKQHNRKARFCGSFRARPSTSEVRTEMLRQFLKQTAIRKPDYARRNFVRASSGDGKRFNLEVKINRANETFELHDAETDVTSGKQKKFEFPFVYLRDNCQVRFIIMSGAQKEIK